METFEPKRYNIGIWTFFLDFCLPIATYIALYLTTRGTRSPSGQFTSAAVLWRLWSLCLTVSVCPVTMGRTNDPTSFCFVPLRIFFWITRYYLWTRSSVYSQALRRGRKPLRDHHLGRDALLSAGCECGWEERVDPSHPGCVKDWKITLTKWTRCDLWWKEWVWIFFY